MTGRRAQGMLVGVRRGAEGHSVEYEPRDSPGTRKTVGFFYRPEKAEERADRLRELGHRHVRVVPRTA